LKSEQAVQQALQLKASKMGARLWRNNVGVLFDDRGVPIRYGLCNETSQENKNLKSSDLIGITPVTITPDMVGRTVGVFTAYECKKEGWYYTGNNREKAQLAFINLVQQLGGRGGFVNE